MSSVLKLHYGTRIGYGAKNGAKSELSAATVSSEADLASARYARWFRGEIADPEPTATSAKKFRAITSDMDVADIIAITKENLTILGDDACDLFVPKLPVEHRMRKAVRSSVLPNAPHLGVCKFGEIVTGRSAKAVAVTQIFIANFDGDVDTAAGGAELYKPSSRDFDQMFFGLHMILDLSGNFLGFNHLQGDRGLAFKTKDVATALYNIASASTGLSLETLHARAAANRSRAR